MKKFFLKLTTISVLFFFTFLTGPGQIFAAGTVGPVGPQGLVGVNGQTGTQGVVGSTAQTGTVSTPIADPGISTSSENSLTGPNSTNSTASQLGNNTNIGLENNSNINNNVDISVDTGNNVIGGNTSAGNVATGDANVGLNIINASNSTLNPNSTYGSSNVNGGTNLSLGTPVNRISFENFLTGPESENSNLIDVNGNLAVSEVNNSDINNDLVVDINTGQNQIDGNTKIGDLVTGDINACINLLNLSNIVDPLLTIAVDSWNIIGDVDGNIVFENSATGPESENSNVLNSENNINVTSSNDSHIINNAEINTNTGDNTSENNTVIGDITTGIANVKESIVNFANVITSPVFYVFNIFGQFTGDLSGMGIDPNYAFVNEITGPESENSNLVNAENNVNINLENNSEIKNNVRVNANTGRNTIGNNTIAGDVETGAINIGLNMINLSNIIGKDAKKFCIRIINIFGNWNCNKNEEKEEEEPGNNGGVIVNPPPTVVVPPREQAVLGNKLSRIETPAIKSVALVKGEELGNPPVSGPKNNYDQLMYALIILLGIAGLWTGFEILTFKKNK